MNGGLAVRMAVTGAGVSLLAACSGVAAPTPTTTVTVIQTPEASPSVRADPAAPVGGQYPEGRGPSGEHPHVVDGTWLVGTDIAAGVWRTLLDETYGCQWAVSDGTNIIDSGSIDGGVNATLRLVDGDLFTTENCQVWNYLGTNYASSGSAGFGGDFTKNLGAPVNSGSFIVGRGMPAGRYELVDPISGSCSVTVKYEDKVGEVNTALSFSASDFTSRSVPELIVDLKRGDIFEADGCGNWQQFRYTFE